MLANEVTNENRTAKQMYFLKGINRTKESATSTAISIANLPSSRPITSYFAAVSSKTAVVQEPEVSGDIQNDELHLTQSPEINVPNDSPSSPVTVQNTKPI